MGAGSFPEWETEKKERKKAFEGVFLLSCRDSLPIRTDHLSPRVDKNFSLSVVQAFRQRSE